jgi:hypothetical protein
MDKDQPPQALPREDFTGEQLRAAYDAGPNAIPNREIGPGEQVVRAIDAAGLGEERIATDIPMSHLLRFAVAFLAAPQPTNAAPRVLAWVDEEGERAITHKTKEGMLRDGGASASSVKAYSVPAYAAPPDKGPWHVRVTGEGVVYIESDDFDYDASLRLTGNFGGAANRKAYAEQIAAQLNAAAPSAAVQPGYTHADVADAHRKGYELGLAQKDRALAPAAAGMPQPVDMVLFCPKCGMQHIDTPMTDAQYTERLHESSWWELGGDKPERWTNPPHRSHLCHGCGHIWRPADVATNGVAAVKTKGSKDSPLATPATAASEVAQDAARMDWLENAYTRGAYLGRREWNEFMTSVAERGFRGAIDAALQGERHG